MLVMTTKEGSTKIFHFMTHGAGVLVLQTEYNVMMTKEGCTKIVHLMTSGTGVLVLVHICHKV